MEWIQAAQGVPYFRTETGKDWTPIGHNDAITWPALQGCFRGRDLASANRYVSMLAENGVTVLRLMLEYNHREHRYFERPAGTFQPAMVRLWDELFGLCERNGIRVLVTPFDTFWMWKRWSKHPYNGKNGGPSPGIARMLIDGPTRAAIKRRLQFVTERWGASGVIFAWDVWNEIHPAMAENSSGPMFEFIEDLSTFLRETETRLHGRTHPQTVSIFGPVTCTDAVAAEAVLRHPCLDFASTHFYEEGAIDDPRNTVDAAISTGAIVRDMLAQTTPGRPFFDSESGPIHTFKDKHRVLPEAFDDEYFRHMQWAHFASGGAGGGMRWPNRRPHILTPGMHKAQRHLSGFLPLIEWQRFDRVNWNHEARIKPQQAAALFACGDREQAVVWLLRRGSLDSRAQVSASAPVRVNLFLPEMGAGIYDVTFWDTRTGTVTGKTGSIQQPGATLELREITLAADVAIAVSRHR